jgi:hypothetical protein
VPEEVIEGGGERHRISGLNHESRIAPAESRGHLSYARGDNRKAGEHGFEQRKGETLGQGGQHKDVRATEQVGDIGPQTKEVDSVGELQLAGPCFQLACEFSPSGERKVDGRMPVTQQSQRREQHAVALDWIEIPHGKQ